MTEWQLEVAIIKLGNALQREKDRANRLEIELGKPDKCKTELVGLLLKLEACENIADVMDSYSESLQHANLLPQGCVINSFHDIWKYFQIGGLPG